MPTLPTFEDPKLRDACQERCAEFGDPPCYETAMRPLPGQGAPPKIKPCGECLRDVGIEPGDEFDENAALGKLL